MRLPTARLRPRSSRSRQRSVDAPRSRTPSPPSKSTLRAARRAAARHRAAVAGGVGVPRLLTASCAARGAVGERLGGVLLRGGLPVRWCGRNLRLVYSTVRDGASLRSFYKAVKGGVPAGEPVVFLVRDGGGGVFGAFVSDGGWRGGGGGGSGYFGGGESFVFRLEPEVAVYPWSRRNSFFQLAGVDRLSLGGGGAFAISLDASLDKGSSGACETWDSPCLATSESFDCVVFEAWALEAPRLAAARSQNLAAAVAEASDRRARRWSLAM